MPRTLEAVQAEVMQLSPSDRARLLDRLVVTLDVDAEMEGAWAERDFLDAAAFYEREGSPALAAKRFSQQREFLDPFVEH